MSWTEIFGWKTECFGQVCHVTSSCYLGSKVIFSLGIFVHSTLQVRQSSLQPLRTERAGLGTAGQAHVVLHRCRPYLFSVTGPDVEVSQFLMIVILVVKIFERFLLL